MNKAAFEATKHRYSKMLHLCFLNLKRYCLIKKLNLRLF
ncbi:hypothetical protein CFF8240_1315 [Campylobacter fetus subsp. fetus 82-40]|uniref:Uncharacterized protein n=1 Tax=Campylobacter fetus subsp. fetus (strain 82-40) TaxID=360106 RepID=A0RQI3_CAMFF|nr:hypothetical protein CFF8240_1315 [Campylobacter fetus subsp. fetus 82-40]